MNVVRVGRRGFTVLALVLGVVTGAGLAYAVSDASAPATGNVVVACVSSGTGNLRVVSSASACKANEQAEFLQTAVAGGQTSFAVNCAAGQKIGDVLNRVTPGIAPVTITITGTCTEAVQIYRDNVSLSLPMGPNGGGGVTAPDSGRPAITIGGRSVSINGLTLAGGANGIMALGGASFSASGATIAGADTGILLSAGANADLSGVAIAGSTNAGIEMQTGSTLNADALTVTRSGSAGVHVWNNSTANITSGSISRNGAGVIAQDGGAANLQGTEISHNSRGGVTSMEGGQITLQGDTRVEYNDDWGVSITGGSSVAFQSSVIDDNTGDGVTIRDLSVGVFQYGTDANTITANSGWGVHCAGPPSAAMITAPPGTVTGNGAGQNNCPSAS